MAELAGAACDTEITDLRHVRSAAEKRTAEEIANREPCEDFDRFKPLFAAVQADIDSGARITQPIRKDRSEEHTSELQSLMRISYAVFCLKKKTNQSTKLNINTLINATRNIY